LGKGEDLQRDKAIREVKASLILEKVADRESIEPTRDEVDHEVERMARQRREPVAAMRLRFQKDVPSGGLRPISVPRKRWLSCLNTRARKLDDQAPNFCARS